MFHKRFSESQAGRLSVLGLGISLGIALLGVNAFTSTRVVNADATFDSTMFNLVNQDRVDNGVAPLELSNPLAAISENQLYSGCGFVISGRAQDMGNRNYFSHQISGCGNQYVFNIMQADGLHYSSAGENIAWESGITDPVQAANYLNNLYMNSTEHRANILNSSYTEMGLGSWETAPGASWVGGGSALQNVVISTEEFTAGTGTGTPLPPCSWPSSSAALQAQTFGGGSDSDLAIATGSADCVMASNGSSFSAPAAWANTAFAGSRGIISGDVDGGGNADLVAINNNSTWVALSNGSGFATPTQWFSGAFYGSRGTFVADVNGDGKGDLVAINDNSVWVMLSTGSGFGTPTQWSSGAFYGGVSTVPADATGDGKADIVAINNNSAWVITSNGSSFSAPNLWSSTPFQGSRATIAADVTGNGKADLIAVNDTGTWVMTSNGSGFSGPSEWSNSAFYGSRANLAADVDGHGKADLVAVGTAGTWVMTSNGSGFNAPSQWSTSFL